LQLERRKKKRKRKKELFTQPKTTKFHVRKGCKPFTSLCRIPRPWRYSSPGKKKVKDGKLKSKINERKKKEEKKESDKQVPLQSSRMTTVAWVSSIGPGFIYSDFSFARISGQS